MRECSDEQEDLEEDKYAMLTVYNPAGRPNYEKLMQDRELVLQFPMEPYVNCLMLIQSGRVYVEDVIFSFNFLSRGFSGICPAILADEDADIVIKKCTIIGNKNYHTIGMLLYGCDAKIMECKIMNNHLGGIHIFSTERNHVTIINNKLLFNDLCGINAIGPDAAPSIEAYENDN